MKSKTILNEPMSKKITITNTVLISLLVLGLMILAVNISTLEHLINEIEQYQIWDDSLVMIILFTFTSTAFFCFLIYYLKGVQRRRLVDQKIEDLLNLEHTVSKISFRFINNMNMDESIFAALADIGKFYKADRAFLFLRHDNGGKMDNTHEWCADGVPAKKDELQGLDFEGLPWAMETYKNGKILCINDVLKLSSESAPEKAILTELGVKSIMTMPIINGGRLDGLVGISHVVNTTSWTQEKMALLQISSSIYANALQRWELDKQLHQSYNELEKRIEERTADLITANHCLEKEIVEHREAQQCLYQSELRYRKLIEMLPDAVVVQHEDKILFTNKAGVRLVGADDSGDIIGKSILDFLHPDYHQQATDKINLLFMQDSSLPVSEEKLIRMDGTVVDVEVSAIPLLYEKKNEILAIIRDVTERKHLEDTLIKSRQRYHDLINNLPDAVFIHTLDEIFFANQAAAKLMGFDDPQKLIGRSMMDFIPPEKRKIARDRMEAVMNQQDKFFNLEITKIQCNGLSVDLELTAIPYNYNDIPSALVVLRDITEHKQNEQLNKILNETVAYDALKTEFFSNISHELKTPLNVILGTVQLLTLFLHEHNEEQIGLDTGKYISIMKQNCYRLLRLVNNLIDITRIDCGFYQVNLKNLNIISVVEEICMSVADYMKSKGIYFEFDTDIEEKTMACDPDKMERIMLNLLSNAIKFSNTGGSICVGIEDHTDKIRISVKDTGCGIPGEKLETIFERFRQVDKSLSRNREGSGIGLSLVKSIIEMHGGSIEVQSEEDRGSEFIILLPVCEIEETKTTKVNYNIHRSTVERIQIEFSDIYA